ncbi:MAG: cytochrome c3 family protein [Gemmatimonadota bacterium]|nr:cytochrome c3 family protein [Gemmatimonadota bacterium]
MHRILAAGLLAAGIGGFAPAVAGAQDAAPQADAARQDSLPPGIVPRTPTGQTAAEAIAAHMAAADGPEQPIPFSHRFHAQELVMQCEYCHVGTEISQAAVLPPVELCMGCHRIVGAQLEPIQRLRGYWEREEPVPWERIYKVPDFVQFPHEAHVRSQVDCAECHGEVENMDRVYKFSSLKMGWCLDCHWQEGEPTDVATDRLLVEKFPPPQSPGGRQPAGLYPRDIDQQYGANRAPIDCSACHY